MNISKKMIMSFIVALTSVVAMAQPYYHIMKEINGRLIEEKGYDGKDYNIKIDMNEPKPKDAIGGKITIESDCDFSEFKRSFWFTKNGNVYYNYTEGKFYFEKSQLDYPSGPYSKDHCGHFGWNMDIGGCIAPKPAQSWNNAKETDFYFADPKNLPKLKEDLGNEEWAVLSYCEWDFVCKKLGECWQIDDKICFLIDTTPGKSLLKAIKSKNRGKTMSKQEFESYEAQGLVCLPPSGYRSFSDYDGGPQFSYQVYRGYYWSCTPANYLSSWSRPISASLMRFDAADASVISMTRNTGLAVRLVILAEED